MKRFTRILKPVAILLATSLVFSCDPGKKSDNQEGKVVINATDKMTAQELIDSAEQVVSPYSFMMAYRLSQMALEKDPENVKALFYNKLLKRFEVFRGILSRVKSGLSADEQARLQSRINSFPNSPLKSFLTEQGSELKSVESWQGLIGQYFAAVSEFRTFLKEKENSEMSIYLNPLVFAGAIQSELANSCRVNSQDQHSMNIECDYSNAATKKLNMADFVVLRQMAAGEMIWGMELNSYSLEGLRELGQQSGEGMTAKQKWERLFQNEKFGKLRSDNLLPKLKEIGSDLGAAVNWAIQYKSTLCPKGMPSSENRPTYLISTGICLNSSPDLTNALTLLDNALKGVVQVTLKDGTNTHLDFFAWSRSPIADLRSIEPVWDASGNHASTFKDNTLGGFFVDNNAGQLLLRN